MLYIFSMQLLFYQVNPALTICNIAINTIILSNELWCLQFFETEFEVGLMCNCMFTEHCLIFQFGECECMCA